MASSAQQQQLAASLSLANFGKATELKKRLWFTLGALIVFRLVSFVPLPGIDPEALGALFARTQGGVLDFFNMFSGGALQRMALIALGVTPYITASIIVQLMTSLVPSLMSLKKEGESGRKKLNQYTRYGTVLLTACRAMASPSASRAGARGRASPRSSIPAGSSASSTVITLIGGTMFLMWLGEQITSRGIGNGISLIIMAGIVSRLPISVGQLFEQTPHRGDLAAVHPDGRGPRPRHDRVHLPDGARPAEDPDPISQAPGRHAAVSGRQLVPAAQDQHQRRHPADLRVVAAADAADRRAVPRQGRQRSRLAADGDDAAPARRAGLHGALRRRASSSSASSTPRSCSTPRRPPRTSRSTAASSPASAPACGQANISTMC